MVWNFLAYGLGKLVVLLTTSILARILARDDFGLVAIAVVVINYLSVIKDLGLGVALIQRKEAVDDAADTVFTINLIVGFFLTIIIFPFAPFIASYFGDPMVAPVLRWLGVTFALNALGAVHIILLTKELDYRKKFIPDMGNAIVKGVASIGLAYAGFGVWALVFGQLLGVLTSVILVWLVLPWRPRLALKREIAAVLMTFGATVFIEDILSIFNENLSSIVTGRLLGLEQLSIFTLAIRLPEMLLIGNLWVMTGITFPAFSAIQDDPNALRRGALMSIRIVQIIAVPISLGMLLSADPIIRVVFGDKWLDAIPLLRIFAIYAWVHSIGFHIGDIYKAIGRPDILLKLTIFSTVLLIPSIWIGSRFGLVGLAWGQLFATVVQQIVSLKIASLFVDMHLKDIVGELKPSALGGAVMIPVVFLAMTGTQSSSPFMQLAVVSFFGAVAYIGILWIVERENFVQLLKKVGVLI